MPFFHLALFLFASFTILSVLANNSTTSNNSGTSTPSKSSSTSTSGSIPTSTLKTSKRGLAFSTGDTPGDLNNANQTNSVITWQYDWGSIPATYITDSHIEYVPMQWGSYNAGAFSNAVKSQGAKTILAFNEPDAANQANIPAKEAASIWQQFLEPLKASGVRLGGPAVTASGTGIPWLIDFFSACSNCSVDFIPLHWYGEGVGNFYQYLWSIHGQFPSKPIWVTEYACTSTNETVIADFLNQSITYLDSLDWIERYAWFGFYRETQGTQFSTGLLDNVGGLNDLGQRYVGAKTVHTQVITQVPTQTFTTVNGADSPTQGLVTTYPALSNYSPRRWTFSGGETLPLGTAFFVGALCTML